MILLPLTRHLAICAMDQVQRMLDLDRDFWQVISIRDTTRSRLEFRYAQHTLPLFFDDAEIVEEGSRWIVMSAAQARQIWEYVESSGTAPLLVHCVAGLSRSTAVAAAIIVRGLLEAGTTQDQVAAETVERLLAIRPPACPNGLVLLRMLEEIMPAEQARRITQSIWEDDRIMHNRFVRPH